MSRLAPILPKDMTDEQLDYYKSIRSRASFTDVPPEEPLVGPFHAWQRSPAFGQRMTSNSKYLRYEGLLEARIVELVIITIVRLWSARFAFNIHAEWTIEEGIDEAIVEAIRHNQTPNFTKPDEEAVYNFAYRLMTDREVDDATYAAALSALGEAPLVELVGLCGHYVTACMTLKAFQIPPRPGDEPFTD
jgi:4-carboxymuconolactone decarboxylase